MQFLLEKTQSAYSYVSQLTQQFLHRASTKKPAVQQIINQAQHKYFLIRDVLVARVNALYIYTRWNKKDSIVEQASSKVKLTKFSFSDNNSSPARQDDEDIHKYDEMYGQDAEQPRPPVMPIRLKWQKINMTVKQFEKLKKFTLSINQFKKIAEFATCPITHLVMKEPCKMKCCREFEQKLNRYAQKSQLEYQIQVNGRCLLCRSPADLSFICEDAIVQTLVIGLRERIEVTYRQLDDDQKRIWKQLIDQSFDQGYTEQHLDNSELIVDHK